MKLIANIKVLRTNLPSHYIPGYIYSLAVYYLLPLLLGIVATRLIRETWYDIFWTPTLAYLIGISLPILLRYDLEVIYFNVYNGANIISVCISLGYLISWNLNPAESYLEARYSFWVLVAAALTFGRRYTNIPNAFVLRDIAILILFTLSGNGRLLEKLSDPLNYDEKDLEE